MPIRSASRSMRGASRATAHARRTSYNPPVPFMPLSGDTSPSVERLQVKAWRQMSPAQKAATVTGLTQASYEMALAGVRARFPDASRDEHFLRLALVTLGRELACRAYPEILRRQLD
jgi:hypothetical protein